MTRISSPGSATPHAPDPAKTAGLDDAGPARPASGPTPTHTPSVGDGRSAPSHAAALASKFEAGSRQANVATARRTVDALARELPGHGVEIDAFAARFATPHYARASQGEIVAAARYQFVRAALANNPGLADRAIASRLRGVAAPDRRIVEQTLSRSGTTGLSRYALAERTLAAIQPFTSEQRADILGLVETGDSVGQATTRERAALADLAAEAGASREAHPGKPRAAFDVTAQTAHWNKVLDTANAAFRRLPVLSRGAELATGVASSLGAAETIAVGAAHSFVTLEASHISRATEHAGNAAGYVFGELSGEIHKADGLYLQLSRQHEEFTQLSRTVLGATKTHAYDEVPAAIARMKTLATQMDATSKHFLAVAQRVDEANKQFDDATVEAAEDVLFKAGMVGAAVGLHGAEALTRVMSKDEIVEHVRAEARAGILNSEAQRHVNRSVMGRDE